MGRRYSEYRDFFPRSVPLPAKGGIKAQTGSGKAFGKSWWAKRWIAVLESSQIGARLQRGRSYARHGQVLQIQVEQGVINAQVQGSRSKPYRVVIKVKVLEDKDWGKVIEVLSREALFIARLLSGEMPQDIERIFTEANCSLFPQKLNDLQTDCSCPDWSNPCKHIAAVFYLMGEEFDRDPFLIFKLRGMDQDSLTRSIANLSPVLPEEGSSDLDHTDSAIEESCPLSSSVERFWSGGQLPVEARQDPFVSGNQAVLLRQLGALPFWRGTEPLSVALADSYALAADTGQRILLGENPRGLK